MDTLPTSCCLCPRRCQADRAQGQRGLCGADDTLVVARAALHEWEEPCISARQGSGTIFFANCPLRCVYCQNTEIAHGGTGLVIDVKRLAQIMCELQDQDAANVNLVTPTQYVLQIIEAVSEARTMGLAIPIVYNTSGYELDSVIAKLEGTVDVYLTDFKYWKSEASDAASCYSHAPDYFDVALPSLDAMVASTGRPVFADHGVQDVLERGVLVRHMMLPGRLEDSKRVVGYLWERYGDNILYSIMNQYTPMSRFERFPELNECVDEQDYERLLDYADGLGMDNYYWQQGGAAQESFIPSWNGQGV